MRLRLSAVSVIGALILASPAAADPAQKPKVEQASQPAEKPVQTMLASASDVQMPQPMKQDEAAPAPKRRAARVTACRCGDTSQQ